MKFLDLTFFAGFAAAASLAGRCTAPGGCVLEGFNGIVTSDTTNNPTYLIPNIKDPEECRKKCYSAEFADCQSFGIRYTGAGACRLWNYQVTPRGLKPGEAVSTYVYYNTPAGIQGWVPENVAQHYFADTSKTKGNYAACRKLCLEDPICKAFGFKPQGNCQLYSESLIGKVKATTDSPYIQYEADCTAAPYTLATFIPKPTAT